LTTPTSHKGVIINDKTATFWQQFLATTPDAADAEQRYYEIYQIGDTAEDADFGAQLIIEGKKTTTSALWWEYEGTGNKPPTIGALSIVEDGRGTPVCVVETTWLATIPLNAVEDVPFIIGYAEWGETAQSWQQSAWDYYAPHCRTLGLEPTPDMPILCERFEIIYP
jgi:uncharacterized protein YhfF